MELGDLDKLSSAELRKLITLMSRETTLKKYQHKCSDQRKCSACDKWLCYACYNLHLYEVHGPEVAHYNARLDAQTNIIQQERKERSIKVKVKVKITSQRSDKINRAEPRAAKPKTLNFEEIQQQVKDGIMSKEQLLNIIQKL